MIQRPGGPVPSLPEAEATGATPTIYEDDGVGWYGIGPELCATGSLSVGLGPCGHGEWEASDFPSETEADVKRCPN